MENSLLYSSKFISCLLAAEITAVFICLLGAIVLFFGTAIFLLPPAPKPILF